MGPKGNGTRNSNGSPNFSEILLKSGKWQWMKSDENSNLAFIHRPRVSGSPRLCEFPCGNVYDNLLVNIWLLHACLLEMLRV